MGQNDAKPMAILSAVRSFLESKSFMMGLTTLAGSDCCFSFTVHQTPSVE